MPYVYAEQRPWLFTEEGSTALIKARDNAMVLLKSAGAFMSMAPLRNVDYGDTFKAMAILDRLVEMGDIRELTGPSVAGQDRVFVSARWGQ